MSNRKLRSEKNCLNCGARVEEQYCPVCGQENVINRPSFTYLFRVFFQDLINYDSNFWRTINTLLFRPGVIIKMYLAGKRKAYVNPIKLYFFVSLIAFLIPSFLIDFDEKNSLKDKISEQIEIMEGMEPEAQHSFVLQSLDSVQKYLPEENLKDSLSLFQSKNLIGNSSYYYEDFDSLSFKRTLHFDASSISINAHPDYQKAKTVREFDSIHQSIPKEQKMGWAKRMLAKKFLELDQREFFTQGQFIDRFKQAFNQNLLKVLIFYLLFFAFVLWIFHGKKKWKYYDHGVFTLYFFSFLLMMISFNLIGNWIFDFLRGQFPFLGKILHLFLLLSIYSYLIFYFFRSHSRVYEERKWISRFKSLLILGINSVLFLSILIAFTIYTFWMI